MLALDQPFIASSKDSALESFEEICLEYGSATQLYLVPLIQHEEQVSNGYLESIEIWNVNITLVFSGICSIDTKSVSRIKIV